MTIDLGAAAPSAAVMVSIAGEVLELRAERAVWWPARRTLFVADLHVGKEEAYRRFGVALPRSILEETIERLDALVRALGVERVVVLGDLIHAAEGMSIAVVERFAAWRATFVGEVALLAGNHDRKVKALPDEWRLTQLADGAGDGPFVFRHEPPCAAPDDDERYCLCGHLHPTVRLERRFDRLILPCFVIGAGRAILPAFTAFSRGPGMEPERGDRLFAVARGEVIEVMK